VATNIVYFYSKCGCREKAQMCEEMNIMSKAISGTYLVLPAMVGLDRTESFIHLLERVIEGLKGLKERFLSMGRKEILLKAIIQSIPYEKAGAPPFQKKIQSIPVYAKLLKFQNIYEGDK
jgi:hypothetical protein